MASVLVHTCCAPCAIYTVEHLRGQGFELSALWYNPNIHPFMEHQHRLEAMQSYVKKAGLPLIVPQGYHMISYFRAVVGHEGERCLYCFQVRLSRTAQIARERKFNYFTTTLLISPYQKHELLKDVGQKVAQETGVDFLYQDLRPGFRESHRASRELGLYHQQYCGCLYSEWERFSKLKVETPLD